MTLTEKIEHLLNTIAEDIANCQSTEDTDHVLGAGIRNLDQAEAEDAELIAHRDAGAFYAADQDGELVLLGPGGDALYRDVERQPDPTWTSRKHPTSSPRPWMGSGNLPARCARLSSTPQRS